MSLTLLLNTFLVGALFFISANFSIHSYLVHKRKTGKQLYDHRDWEVSIMLYYLFWYKKT